MNRRLVLLNLALLALAGALVWTLRTNWLASKARERAVLQRKVAAKTVLAPPPLPTVKAVAPAEYIDVAGKMLFSKDRNPTVVVEPPKPPPEPVMPALPNYHGQMSIGEPVILLSTSAAGAQRSYHAGDQVGDFKLVSFDEARADFEWKGKNVERKLEELRPKETTTQAGRRRVRRAAHRRAGPRRLGLPRLRPLRRRYGGRVAGSPGTGCCHCPGCLRHSGACQGVTSLAAAGNGANSANAGY